MENASKALLIAAGVLIVILIITLGIKLINPTQGISDNAETVGEAIKNSTQEASKNAQSAIVIEGDLNGDRKANDKDLKILQQYLNNNLHEYREDYDLNKDGNITATDYHKLLLIIKNNKK